MSNVSIYEKNWIDLVFENKNKTYGAYQLRQENPRTTLIAFFSGTLLILSLIGIWLLLSSFGNKAIATPIDIDDPTLVITDVNYPNKEPKKEEVVTPFKKEEATKKEIDKKDLQNAVLVKENPDDVRTNKEMKENPIVDNNATSTTGTTGTTAATGTTTTATTGTVATTVSKGPEGPVPTIELDRLPEYPGGMKRFYGDVGNNFEKPDVDSNYASLSVIMSFVIEKDGTMTNIKVLRSSEKSMEREAIRVLKSMRAKWSPGYKDGEKVRVLYTLPIKVAL